MTNRIANRSVELVQARMSRSEVEQLDTDAGVLGLPNRSEAVRQAIVLLHRQAREAELAQSYDDYYGRQEAPLSDVASIGDLIAGHTIIERG